MLYGNIIIGLLPLLNMKFEARVDCNLKWEVPSLYIVCIGIYFPDFPYPNIMVLVKSNFCTCIVSQ